MAAENDLSTQRIFVPASLNTMFVSKLVEFGAKCSDNLKFVP
jgi:hypothetical protein